MLSAEWRVLIVKFGIRSSEFRIEENDLWFYLKIKTYLIFPLIQHSPFRIQHSNITFDL